MPTTEQDLKYRISRLIVKNVADSLGWTTEEYGSVYGSEAHEKMLIEIMELIQLDRLDTRINENHHHIGTLVNASSAGLGYANSKFFTNRVDELESQKNQLTGGKDE